MDPEATALDCPGVNRLPGAAAYPGGAYIASAAHGTQPDIIADVLVNIPKGFRRKGRAGGTNGSKGHERVFFTDPQACLHAGHQKWRAGSEVMDRDLVCKFPQG